MKRFWISWYHRDTFSEFELDSPWWISGSGDGFESICAAVMAENQEAAEEIVLNSYDVRPEKTLDETHAPWEDEEALVWRFCNQKPDDWSPFSDRFGKAEWMHWK